MAVSLYGYAKETNRTEVKESPLKPKVKPLGGRVIVEPLEEKEYKVLDADEIRIARSLDSNH